MKTRFPANLYLFCVLGLEWPGLGATNTVTITNDSGPGSLRDIIQTAVSGDTIDFSVLGAITLTNGELLVTNSLSIIGPGASALAIDGNNSSRIFEIGSNISITISGLTLRAGHSSDGANSGNSSSPGGKGADGGCIYNSGTLTLNACTVTSNSAGNGGDGYGTPSATDGGNGGLGGAIYNPGTLRLHACDIRSNRAGRAGSGGTASSSSSVAIGGIGGEGGAIYNLNSLSLTACTISGNAAGDGNSGGNSAFALHGGPGGRGGHGGAIFNGGWLALTNCSVTGNASGAGASGGRCCFYAGLGGDGGSGGYGRAIYCTNNLTLVGCTFSGNNGGSGGTGGDGGGMFSGYGGKGGYGGDGGGIYVSGSMTLIGCTLSTSFAGNAGPGGSGIGTGMSYHGGNGGSGGSGGAIREAASLTTPTLRNGLVALNSAGAGASGGSGSGGSGTAGAAGTGSDLAGSFKSQSFNLVGITNGCTGFTNGVNGDLTGSSLTPLDPKLGALATNGGPTLTMALLAGSPALDAGDDSLPGPPFYIANDERSLPRKSGAHVDIGAFERQGLVLTRVAVAGSNIMLSVMAEVGSSYRVERKDNLGAGSWSTVTDNLAGTGAILQVIDAGGANHAQRFYRARTVP